jgi:hypothetical protein
MRIPQQIVEALTLFGVWQTFVQTMQSARSFEAVETGLEHVLAAAKASFKRQALDAHPDRCGGSEERMKALSAAWNAIKDMKAARPQPMTVVRVAYHTSTTWTGASSTTTGGWSGF